MALPPEPLYKVLASTVNARDNCSRSKNDEWRMRHETRLRELVKHHLPSGSGFDVGTKLDEDRSTGERLVFHTSFHHMNEGGCYDGWTEHRVTVRPSLGHGFVLSIGGRNRNQIKDVIGEEFHAALSTLVDPYWGIT